MIRLWLADSESATVKESCNEIGGVAAHVADIAQEGNSVFKGRRVANLLGTLGS